MKKGLHFFLCLVKWFFVIICSLGLLVYTWFIFEIPIYWPLFLFMDCLMALFLFLLLWKGKTSKSNSEYSTICTASTPQLHTYVADSEIKVIDKTKNCSVTSIVPDSEKKYYQPDSYYTDVVNEGTAFERRVITFEERKNTAIPSTRGLYPAEILLLSYCSKGTYPGPKYGYPGFWWFEYGIRDVDAALRSLEERGYIALKSVRDSVSNFTVVQLKELLAAHGQSTTGKKAELIERVSATVPEEALVAAGLQAKYALTGIGQLELEENAYVPYMHSIHNKTVELEDPNISFNVWIINKMLGTGDKTNWNAIVAEQEHKAFKEMDNRRDMLFLELKGIDPTGYQLIQNQDKQIAAVQKAKNQYYKDKDLNKYIAFWETVWANGGLIFEGAGWHFELPDLYIKAKRYDDALDFVNKLKKDKPTYAYKAESYIEKIKKWRLSRPQNNCEHR